MAWVGIEINLLSFIPLILRKNRKYNTEGAVKYFLIQALASSLIIAPSVSLIFLNYSISVMLLIALIIKIGAAPLHQWLPSIIERLSWPNTLTLLTLQKINPFVIIFILPDTISLNTIIYTCIILSSAVGAIRGLIQTSVRKIIVFSSIAHIAWLLTTTSISPWAWISYFFIYFFILFSALTLFFLFQIFYLNQITFKINFKYSVLVSLAILSLGGLPPFTGFLPKLIVTQLLISHSNHFPLFPLLISTFISLFFYIRLTLVNILMIQAANSTFIKTPLPSILSSVNLSGLIIPPLFFVILLDFKLYLN